MAQENANVLHAALHADQDPGPELRCVAATGVDLATLQFIAPNVYRFSLVEAIADPELVVSLAAGLDDDGGARAIGWRRAPGDLTLRVFDVLPENNLPLRWSIEFWRVPPCGPSAPFVVVPPP